MTRTKQRSFASDLGFSNWWRLMTMTRQVGKVSVTLISLVTGSVAGIALLCYFFLGLGGDSPLISLGDVSIPVQSILYVIFVLFAALFALSIVLAGDNARRFWRWEGLYAIDLRQLRVKADDRPISKTITRVVFYSLFAAEIAFFIWWWIFTAQPLLIAEQITDPIQLDEALRVYAEYRLGIYLPILPVLIIVCIFAVLGLERVPGFRFFLRRTRLLIIPVVPLIGVLQLRTLAQWVVEVFNSSLPNLLELFQ
jgi:hypothetical protein